MASDLLFYNIFAPQKIPLLKISHDVIVCDLRFDPLQSKIPDYVLWCARLKKICVLASDSIT